MRTFHACRAVFLVMLLGAAALAASAQTLTTLHNFVGSEGALPAAPLLLGHDGNYYGTTYAGGADGYGNVFKMTPSGTVTNLHSFCPQLNCADGYSPEAALVLGSDGNFYGTAAYGAQGGGSGAGAVFKISSSGTYTVLYKFCQQRNCTDGSNPFAPVVLATDGNFYGTTYVGGANGVGAVFRMSPSGHFTSLYSFDQAHGKYPNGLVQGRDGNLYGTTNQGGTNNSGTAFKMTLNGAITLLYNFCSQTACADGAQPHASLIQGTDGNFYGTTALGNASNAGTVFKMTTSGAITTLHSFNSTDGSEPSAALLQASDGNFYGTTSLGGTGGAGSIFAITPAGAFTSLHSFSRSDGANPQAALVQVSSGVFDGTAYMGGSGSFGTVFHLAISLAPTTTVLTTSPNPSYQGQSVTMTATVTAQNGSTPSGSVTFKSNGVSIGSAALDDSGVAVLNYAGLSAGTDSVTAVYQGSPLLAGSTSNTVMQVVHPAGVTTVTSSPNPSTGGQQVVITATVGPAGPPQPTGTVGFTSNGATVSGCASVTLSQSRTAVCTTSSLAVGTDAIVATYSGDSNYGPGSGMVVQIVNPIPEALQFVTLPPCRIVDTRNPNGTFGGPAIPANTTRSFPLAQSGNPCNIPANAVAYSLNVTVVPITTLSYLTIWPTGEGQPTVSTLNSLDGRLKANAVIIPAGTSNGSVSVFVTNTTNVVLDINGYFTTSSGSTLEFYPVTPCRLVDTRNPAGPLGGPSLTHGVERDFPLLEGSCIPQGTDVRAYSLNFTVVPKTSGGVAYLTVWPQGQSRPLVSTLNDLTNTIVANAAIVPAGTGSGVATYASNDTDLIVDINGYFAAPGAGGLSYYALTPCRVIDTRHTGNGQPFTGELTVSVQNSPCGPPAASAAYVFNATVVPNGPLSYLTLWPDTENKPSVSTLNAIDGAITSNMAIVPNINGKIDAYAAGLTQLILDISSYFAP